MVTTRVKTTLKRTPGLTMAALVLVAFGCSDEGNEKGTGTGTGTAMGTNTGTSAGTTSGGGMGGNAGAAGAGGEAGGHPAFVPASRGCAMAHCDPQMSDNIKMAPPMPPTVGQSPTLQWLDVAEGGSWYGLGCSSNGQAVSCIYCGATGGDNLVVYDVDGTRRWIDDLNNEACYSTPIIDDEGGVIGSDTEQIARYDASGTRLWTAHLFGDAVFGPVVTASGYVIVTGQRAPGSPAESSVYAFDSRNGQLIGYLDDPSLEGFDTFNTPCVRGDRVYISMKNEELDVSRLQAVDIDPSAAEPVHAGPAFEGFKPPQGASPLCLDDRIYFDGDIAGQTHVIAVRDLGDEFAQLWTRPVDARIEASFSHDPRGGIWGEIVNRRYLYRWDELTGDPLDEIDVDALVGAPGDIHVPSSALSIAGDATAPVMIITARPLVSGTYWILAIDLLGGTLIWKYRFAVDPGLLTAQQYVIVETGSGPLVVYSTFGAPARAIGF